LTALLLDHCVWRPTLECVRAAGYRCVTLWELGRANARNGEVLALTAHRRSVLLTRDADFTNTDAYPLGRHAGIIFLRITPRTMDAVHGMLVRALRRFSAAQLRGNLLIVEPTAYRLRRPL